MYGKIYSPENTLGALNAVEDELITLIGKDWPMIECKYDELKRTLMDEGRKLQASCELIDLFSNYKDARERLRVAIIRQDYLCDIMLKIADIIQSIDSDPEIRVIFNEAIHSSSRPRHIVGKGIDDVRSFKLGNIQFDLGEMYVFGTAIMAIIAERFVGKDIGPFIIAVGILTIAQKLIEKMTVKFNEREATVFYGFSQAIKVDKTASESAILNAVDKARRKIGLEPLNKIQLRNALHQLEKLGTVELVESKDDTWRIMESFRIKKKHRTRR